MSLKRKLAMTGAGLVVLWAGVILVVAPRCPPERPIADRLELGQEYPWPDEDELARKTLDLVRDSIERQYAPGQMRRDAHAKAHGCVRGTFSVVSGLPPELASGVFAEPASYPVWIRFSNGNPKPDTEGDIRGMALKVMDVPGPKLMPDERGTQDFLLISYPALPAGRPPAYYDLFEQGIDGHPLRYFFGCVNPLCWRWHDIAMFRAIQSLKVPSPLLIPYWSTTPYRLGDRAVKYSARPCDSPAAAAARVPEGAGPDYLREVMAAELRERPACFEFMVQVQTDPVAMPVEDAAVTWDEAVSPFVPVAQVEIPTQSFGSEAQTEFCEALSYTPWHSLEEHRPLGGINRIRRSVYEGISEFRHEANDVPRFEPTGEEVF